MLEDHPLSRAQQDAIVDDVLERTRLSDFRHAHCPGSCLAA
ncbi:MAG: hypothetical protein R3E68_12300 [Burkholderiaceae bacterium]